MVKCKDEVVELIRLDNFNVEFADKVKLLERSVKHKLTPNDGILIEKDMYKAYISDHSSYLVLEMRKDNYPVSFWIGDDILLCMKDGKYLIIEKITVPLLDLTDSVKGEVRTKDWLEAECVNVERGLFNVTATPNKGTKSRYGIIRLKGKLISVEQKSLN